MNYLIVAVGAYFLVAIEVVLDKFLISSKKISHPALYTFYVGLMSVFAGIFFPFGFYWPDWKEAFFMILSGVVFIYALLSLFSAIDKSEASRVMPVVGAVIPVVTFWLSIFFLDEKLRLAQIFGAAALIVGGLLISFEFPLRDSKRFFVGFRRSILAGVMLAIAFTWFKFFYERDNFANVFIWSRLGLFLGAVSLLLHPIWRNIIIGSFCGLKKPKNNNYKTGLLFVVNKTLGGVGSIMTHYAIAIGSVTIVNALISVEYVFILIIGYFASLRFPNIFQEKRDWINLSQKAVSIAIIAIGIVLISIKL